MKWLCIIFAVGVLTSAVYAAPANSDMQQGEDEPGVQGLGKTLGSLIDYYQRKSEAAKAQEINQVMENNEAEAEGLLHHLFNNYMEDAELQDRNEIAKSLQDDGKADLQGFKWKKLFKRARKLYKYGKKHGYFGAAAVQQDGDLQDDGKADLQGINWGNILKRVKYQQDGDLMAELESLPEEAQTQFLGTALLSYGLSHILG